LFIRTVSAYNCGDRDDVAGLPSGYGLDISIATGFSTPLQYRSWRLSTSCKMGTEDTLRG